MPGLCRDQGEGSSLLAVTSPAFWGLSVRVSPAYKGPVQGTRAIAGKVHVLSDTIHMSRVTVPLERESDRHLLLQNQGLVTSAHMH